MVRNSLQVWGEEQLRGKEARTFKSKYIKDYSYYSALVFFTKQRIIGMPTDQ